MIRFAILVVFIVFCSLLKSQKISVSINEEIACFTQGNDTVLCYRIAEKSSNGKYGRCNYIHPLYSLDGSILTEDFPADHPHHRGIFWAWHQLYVGDKRIGDPWLLKDFHCEVMDVKELEEKGNFKTIQAGVLWKSNRWVDKEGLEKELVREVTTIKVYPVKNNYRAIDIGISLLALEPNMRIGGSEDAKGYGGFSARIRTTDDMKFSNKTGNVVPDVLPVEAAPWMNFFGSIGKDGAQAGISIFCHPDNPGYPHPWILRAKNSMQNAVYPYPGKEAVSLSNVNPTVLNYRLVVHMGDPGSLDMEGIYADYVER